jgi:hypothetical protein
MVTIARHLLAISSLLTRVQVLFGQAIKVPCNLRSVDRVMKYPAHKGKNIMKNPREDIDPSSRAPILTDRQKNMSVAQQLALLRSSPPRNSSNCSRLRFRAARSGGTERTLEYTFRGVNAI